MLVLTQSIADFAGSQIRPIYEAARKIEVRACTIAAIKQPGTDVLDECAVPMYQEPISIELPQCPKPSLAYLPLYSNTRVYFELYLV